MKMGNGMYVNVCMQVATTSTPRGKERKGKGREEEMREMERWRED